MARQKHRHRPLAPLVLLLCLLGYFLARGEIIDETGTTNTPGAIDEGDSLVQAMGETSLGEEDASGEGGDDLMDLGGMIGNKAPSVSSVGGASVASSFNFTKAAEMRAAALQRSQANSTATATQPQSAQPGTKPSTTQPGLPAQPQPVAGISTANPAAAAVNAGATQPSLAAQPQPVAAAVNPSTAGAGAVPAAAVAAGGMSANAANNGAAATGAMLAAGSTAAGLPVNAANPGAAAAGTVPAAGQVAAAAGQPLNAPNPPGVTALASNAAATNAQLAAKLAAVGAPAAIPGTPAGDLTDNSLADQRSISEASVLPESVKDPRMELGADANATTAPATNFKGAAHIAKRRARHYKSLPGTVSEECRARLTALVSKGLGHFYEAGSLGELLGNASAIMLHKAERQMNEVLASILSNTATTYTEFHLSHTTNNYDECKRSATLDSLRACLARNKKQLRHSEIMWFDEAFLAVLQERLGDVRSMFGFGSGRGDFERYFFEQGVAYTYGLEPGFLGALGFYAPGWEYREGPVQLTSLLPNASGVHELEDFCCYMSGDAHTRVDLVQSFETFEEIPREEHCGIINVLAGMAGRWIAVTMGQLGQGGGHHIANRHKEDFLIEWTRRGLVYRGDITSSIKEDCYMCQLHYLRYNLLIFEVDPSRVVPVDCDRESAAEWAPYENYVEQLVYLPNGTTSPSKQHQKQYSDWQYVLRLKAG